MATQTAQISDQARRTARRVAALIAKADALLITAGAGMSVELPLMVQLRRISGDPVVPTSNRFLQSLVKASA